MIKHSVMPNNKKRQIAQLCCLLNCDIGDHNTAFRTQETRTALWLHETMRDDWTDVLSSPLSVYIAPLTLRVQPAPLELLVTPSSTVDGQLCRPSAKVHATQNIRIYFSFQTLYNRKVTPFHYGLNRIQWRFDHTYTNSLSWADLGE